MHVISRKRLRDFAALHRDAELPLTAWYRTMVKMDFSSFAELKRAFGSVDKVGRMTVFNVGGNKFRLIAAIHFNRQRVYVRHVLTHDAYDLGEWKS